MHMFMMTGRSIMMSEFLRMIYYEKGLQDGRRLAVRYVVGISILAFIAGGLVALNLVWWLT